MLLFCVRHGQSTYNAEERLQGQLNPPLSPLGHQQAQATAETLAEADIEAIFASPLTRAHETAAYTAQRTGLDIQYDDRLKEVHVGVYQGLRWAEIAAQDPSGSERWRNYDPDFAPEGGETRRQLMARGVEFFEDLRATGLDRVAVFSHGALLAAAFKTLIGVPVELSPFSLLNASISQIGFRNQWRIVSLNETAHLKTLSLAPPG